MKNESFIKFLTKIKSINESLIDNIYYGYSLLYENTEEKVNTIKNILNTKPKVPETDIPTDIPNDDTDRASQLPLD